MVSYHSIPTDPVPSKLLLSRKLKPEDGKNQKEDKIPGKDNTKDSCVYIPWASFTAFRLSYASAEQVSHFATALFLGPLPDAWVSLPNFTRAVGLNVTKKKRFMKKSLPRAQRHGGQGDSRPASADGSEYTQECGLRTLYRRILRPDVIQRLTSDELKQGEDVLQQELRRQFNEDSPDDHNSFNSATTDSSINLTARLLISRLAQYFKSATDSSTDYSNSSCNVYFSLTEASSLNQYLPQYSFESLGQARSASSAGAGLSHIRTRTHAVLANSIEKDTMRNISAELKRQLKRGCLVKAALDFLKPEPVSKEEQAALLEEPTFSEKLNAKVVKKLKGFANISKDRSNRLKVRLLDRIMLFAYGEIVRVDKMLVLVKFVPRTFNIMSYSEFSDIWADVEENWLEYFVVLRRGQDNDEFLNVQLYKTGKGWDLNSTPAYSFFIRQDLRVDFYSSLDKRISVIDPTATGTRLFILSTRYYSQSIKWLYLIKGCLDEQFTSKLQVRLALTHLIFEIKLPSSLICNALEQKENVGFVEKKNGYEPYEDLLFRYVRDKVELRLGRLGLPLRQNVRSWLACKFGDRAEDIPNTNLSLLVRSQLFAKSSPLELLQCEEKKPTLPNSIEGFLGFLANSDEGFTSLRVCYKMRYVLTCQNLLFITKYQHGIPPSPQNEFLRGGYDCNRLSGIYSGVYKLNHFELDANGHIAWLDSSQFPHFDRLALEEFSRKVHHIAAADLVIDLCLIKKIRCVLPESVPIRLQHTHFILWYATQSISIHDELRECAFEIEFQNGVHLRLFAASKTLRNEWMHRLTKLSDFWNKARIEHTAARLKAKETNQKRFRTNDGLEVKSSFEQSCLIEQMHAMALTYNLNNSALAMPEAVLCSGYLYYKSKKRSQFIKQFAVLCPGYMAFFSITKRNKVTSHQVNTPCYKRTKTITISDCYVRTECSAECSVKEDLVSKTPGHDLLARLYCDGWKCTDERLQFSLWYGYKRKISPLCNMKVTKQLRKENPELSELIKLLGVRSKTYLFMARSRHEQEMWVHNILEEINRFVYG